MMMDVLGIPSHYEQYGNGEEQVLLLHGWGKAVTLERHLAPIARLLQGDCRVTALEFPAHGQTGKPRETWGVEQFALWTEAAMAALSLNQVTLVAHSFGGRIALWLAANRPWLIKRLVLTGGAGLRRPQSEQEKEAAQRYQQQRQKLEKLKRLPLVGSVASAVQRRLRDSRSSADYLEADEDMKATFVRIVNEDLGPLLPLVKAPTLLIWGELDEATPLWMAQRMEREIPDAALIPFAGRGHFAYLEEAARFAAIVLAFIREDKQAVV
ncbi:MAG: alpha/beta hydrolase [Clostridiales bacterium]|jgi:pimeloyl-ACP methyl ester carboxylesterase|nr:alpha/beta hydrolase [Clostridiales bacterium]